MNNNQLLKDVSIDSTTSFFANGDIKVYPCPWNENEEPVTAEKKVSYRGRITVMEDGKTDVKRYKLGTNPPLYTRLYSTEHCDVLRSQGGLLMERWKFDRRLTIHQVWDIRRREQAAIETYYQTLQDSCNP